MSKTRQSPEPITDPFAPPEPTNGLATPTTQARRGLDPELQAMAKLDRIIADLNPNSTGRVLAWLFGRYAPGCKIVMVTERVDVPTLEKPVMPFRVPREYTAANLGLLSRDPTVAEVNDYIAWLERELALARTYLKGAQDALPEGGQ